MAPASKWQAAAGRLGHQAEAVRPRRSPAHEQGQLRFAVSHHAPMVDVREGLKPHATLPAVSSIGSHLGTDNRRSETCGLCPRGDTHLTYMIDIALNTEFSLIAIGAR
jgi:hypothetical protein